MPKLIASEQHAACNMQQQQQQQQQQHSSDNSNIYVFQLTSTDPTRAERQVKTRNA